MIKLQYIGVKRIGIVVCTGFKLSVRKGEEYDVPENVANELLKTKSWIEVNKKVSKGKKKKEVKENDYKKDEEVY